MRGRLHPKRVAAGITRRIPRRPFRFVLPFRLVRSFLRFTLSVYAADGDRRRAMTRLLELHQDTYDWVDLGAIAYDGGVHAKHRLTRYHEYFVERLRPGDRVLDVGCGKGELAYDLVVRAGASVVGIDNNPHYLEFARARYRHPGLSFVELDLLVSLPEEQFDVVILSNVLEHFDDRVGLLRRITAAAAPDRLLLRVPVWARDWTVPLRQELGLRAFSDTTHYTEYDPDSFRAELAGAGLEVSELDLAWGEIWATALPSSGTR
jgi:SAM-dependent methyltransferase